MALGELSVVFFLQMSVILVTCRIVGALARLCGQPQVIGEMVAGILLGPSLLGLFWPEAQRALFPPESIPTLYIVAQSGIALYMFIVGVDCDTQLLRGHLRSAVAVSLAGIVVPFAAGAGLALWLVGVPGLFSDRVQASGAVLFLGAAIAVTAFPVLARIVQDRGIAGTPLGTVVLAAGAISDVAAWCVFAIVLASFGGGALIAVTAIAGAIAYTLFVAVFGRRWLRPLAAMATPEQSLSPGLLSVVLILVMVAAWLMDAAGIHAVFGAFLLGLAMPRGTLAIQLKRAVEPLAVVFLLPVFFVFSGLNTRFDLIAGAQAWLIAGAVLLAAIGSKAIACWAAARAAGEDQRTSLAIGVLMNCRGVMELILLNIGLQKGIIEAPLFSILVLMAIVTTLMTSPLFEWAYGPVTRLRPSRLES